MYRTHYLMPNAPGPLSGPQTFLGGLLHLIMFALMIALVVALVVWVLHYFNLTGSGHRAEPDPLTIAKTRYARGELTKEQFEHLKKDLS